MFEVVLKGVFEKTVAVSSGPEIALFKRFRDSWEKIDQTAYEPGVADELASPFLKEKAEDILNFVGEKLKVGDISQGQ